MNPESLVSEEPVKFGDHTYTARRNPGELRWQVFREDGLGPVGYLDAVYQPTETTEGWQLKVTDAAGELIGEPGKHAAPGTVPGVNSYNNALLWLHGRYEIPEYVHDKAIAAGIQATEPRKRR